MTAAAPAPEEAPLEIAGQAGSAVQALVEWVQAGWQDILVLLGIAAAVFIVLRIAESVSHRMLARGGQPGERTRRRAFARMIERTTSVFLAILSVTVVFQFSDAPAEVTAFMRRLFMLALIIQAAIWMQSFLVDVIERKARHSAAEGSTLRNAVAILRVLSSAIIWAVAILLLVDNAGFEIAPLIAGLGVGGIAIGLAAQGIFSDLFAALSIIFDKPFDTGDFIIFGDDMGTVEKIGLRSTHIRTLSGQLLVVSNTQLLDSRINNYKRMAERRIVFQVGVTYQTPRDVLRQLPGLLKDSVLARGEDKVRFDRAHFMAYGDSSLNYEIVYYVLSPEYGTFMDIHQEVLLDIHEKFGSVGAEFAYPSRTLFLSAPDGDAVDPREIGVWAGKGGTNGGEPQAAS